MATRPRWKRWAISSAEIAASANPRSSSDDTTRASAGGRTRASTTTSMSWLTRGGVRPCSRA